MHSSILYSFVEVTVKKIDLQSYRYVMISAITLSGLLAAHVVVVVCFFFVICPGIYTDASKNFWGQGGNSAMEKSLPSREKQIAFPLGRDATLP